MTSEHGFGTSSDHQSADPDHAADGVHRSEVGPLSGGPVPTSGASSQAADSRDHGDDDDGVAAVAAQVEQPAKVMRIGTMIKQLLEEVRAAPLDEAGRRRLAEIHASSIRELESGLAPELRDELERLTLPFTHDDDHVPSEAELRIAQAQLVGWLEGLFHGIQTALFAQQMAARQQLEEMRRRALPGGAGGPGGGQAVIVGPGGQVLGTAPGGFGGGVSPGGPGSHGDDGHGTGQYL